MEKGQRVVLKMYPYVKGTISKVTSPLKIGDVSVAARYRVKWDNGDKSGNVSEYELLKIPTS